MKKNALVTRTLSSLFLCALIILGPMGIRCLVLAADESLCAEVKIEIRHELTLERQAFDAHMKINNGLSQITLEDVKVDVRFMDGEGDPVIASDNPNDTDALFFIRIDSMSGINDVSGGGTIEPASKADIHWLIIPAPGAANGEPRGTLYYVGATLSYTIGGEEDITEVTPDYICVKPMPKLVLDYFLPEDVYGDDAFTAEIEPPVPFSLGVRVGNKGAGIARNVKINSAQPRIVENKLGLLIGFVIEGCEVNGGAATPSLLAGFGDIPPDGSGVARWIMTCSLSGRFEEFTARYTHSNELGGQLTALIRKEDVNTHYLVRDVLVDFPGRDNIKDFLAIEGEAYRVYESESMDTEVIDESASASLKGFGEQYSLSVPLNEGFIYVRLPDPHGGQKVLGEVVRSDGKRIRMENAWLSKTRKGSNSWEHSFNLFDVSTTGSYSILYEDAKHGPQPPVLQFIPDRIGFEGQQLSFIVEASDPNATIPALSADPLPAGVIFIDREDGTGVFHWTPLIGQAGRYVVKFTASDGVLSDTQKANITIAAEGDSDADGMLDDWELRYFGTLKRDGTGDYDNDGISDLDEFLNGTDPTDGNHAPSMPRVVAPENGQETTALQPELVIQNSVDPEDDVLSYTFEVYSDEQMTALVASAAGVAAGEDKTSWTVTGELNENSWYLWRVRATDGIAHSLWAYGMFFVNTQNEAPGSFCASSPANNTEVDTLTPELKVTNSLDVDEDSLAYTFRVYEDCGMNTLVVASPEILQGQEGTTSWNVNTPLNDNTWYYWMALVTDEDGATAQSPLVSFRVNTFNHAPPAPAISSPGVGMEAGFQDPDLKANTVMDPDGDMLSYFFELDRMNTFDDASKQSSGEIFDGLSTVSWHVAELEDDTWYFWRVKASDGRAHSPWANGSFFVNTENGPPLSPTARNPGDRAWVATSTPKLKLVSGVDPDEDSLLYRYEVYSATDPDQPFATAETATPEWFVNPQLNDRTWYSWRAQAEDEQGEKTPWTGRFPFFVDQSGHNDPPEAHAGGDIQVDEGERAFLDGSGSYDPDDTPGPLAFYWRFVSLPPGSGLTDAEISDADTPYSSFLPDVTGTYGIELSVNDGKESASDQVRVTCVPVGDLDGDGHVDGDDRNILRAAFGACTGDVGFVPGADYDGDGCITFNDYREWYKLYKDFISN
jgi:hypothetical protein